MPSVSIAEGLRVAKGASTKKSLAGDSQEFHQGG